jgi:hypothetical protein
MQFDIHLERAKQKEREKALKYERNRAEHMLREAQKDEAYREAKRTTKVINPTPKSPQEFIARAEAALARMIDSDNVAAVIFTLKSLGATKGWIEGGKSDEVDLTKLKELKSFFDSVGDKKASDNVAPTLVEPVNAVIESQGDRDEQSIDIYAYEGKTPVIDSSVSLSPLQNSASKLESRADLGSLPGNTSQRKTNFP